MRGTFAIFWVYVVVILAGIVIYTIVGLTHQ
jgi:hypothetical protein